MLPSGTAREIKILWIGLIHSFTSFHALVYAQFVPVAMANTKRRENVDLRNETQRERESGGNNT